MAQKLNITLKIADRTYPLTIDSDLEQAYRQAADEINKLIRSFEGNYDVADRQDTLAMCAIAVSARWFGASLQKEEQQTDTQERMEKIHHLLDSILQQ